MVRYFRGKQEEMPEFGRFTPLQKLQYWGAGLGSLLMIVTGLILWFHTQAMAVLPKWFFDLTAVVHGYEGLLLFLSFSFGTFTLCILALETFPWPKHSSRVK